MAIKNLEIRGAPLIGVATAFSLALTAQNSKATERNELQKELEDCATMIKKTRPTAWNLFWAANQILKQAEQLQEEYEKIDNRDLTN